MKNVICPNCGSEITLNEAEYASIVSQVKNQEFNDEVARREEEISQRFKVLEKTKTVEVEAKISELQQQLKNQEALNKSELEAAVAKKDVELAELRKKANDAVVNERQLVANQVADLQAEINRLNNEAQLKAKDVELRIAEQKESYEQQLRLKDEQVQQYKDFKAKLNTKLVGEDLEQHCLISYDQYIRPFLPNAEFGKDNDSSEGSKGDFIFRETTDGAEVVSIMFEMKNEIDESKTKHKNADFFKKLDDDRKKKHCEYAVLVSMLEKDNEYYDSGIVLAAGYEKMYVVRPQFFLPILTILRQSGLSSLETKKQLEIARQQSVDVSNFEQKMGAFAQLFGKHCIHAAKQREEAVKCLDDIISACNKAKIALRKEEGHYEDAEKNLQEKFTVRALTADSPSLREKFEEAKKLE